MSWIAKSLKGLAFTWLWLVKIEASVVWLGTWQMPQPMFSKARKPATVEAVAGAGVGWLESRMKPAKLTMSDEKSEAGLLLLRVFSRAVASSGVALKRQLVMAALASLLPPDWNCSVRSFWKFSLVTPCSTL